MQKVYLSGSIADFGSYFELNCNTLIDIFKLLSCQIPGFRKHLIDAAEAGVAYEIIKGDKILTEADHLLLNLTDEDIIITEVPAGSSGGAKLIVGLVIVAALLYATGPGGLIAASSLEAGSMGAFAYNAALAVGLSLAISGITELLTGTPKLDSSGSGTDSSYLFNGPTNNLKYGQAVPIAYGELLIGGSPVSSYYLKDPLV